MDTLQAERRASGLLASDPLAGKAAEAVRQAILLQTCIGTPGAVEYLKAHRVNGQVISRVLSGGNVREGDRTAPDGLQHRPT